MRRCVSSILKSSNAKKSKDLHQLKYYTVVPTKIVFVRNRNKRNNNLCIISTDAGITEEKIIRIYVKCWSIEFLLKICKSCLCLTRECR